MIGNKFIAIIAAMVAIGAALAVAGLYIDWQRMFAPPAEPTPVPTFDVVVIEPSGEGVIARRAAPGWQVSVQSGGTKVAEATVDVQGEWSVVLEKPLPAGDHALSLKITSPDC